MLSSHNIDCKGLLTPLPVTISKSLDYSILSYSLVKVSWFYAGSSTQRKMITFTNFSLSPALSQLTKGDNMDYKSATHCGFCSRNCTHTKGRMLVGDKVFCDAHCYYLWEYNMKQLQKEYPNDTTSSPDSS